VGNSRWGTDDERGAYNLVDAHATQRGIAAVRTGTVLSLAVPIEGGSRGPAVAMRAPAQHFMTRDGGDYAACLPERGGFGFSDDVIMLPTHGTTHLDAIAHVWRDGRMYNGFASTTVTSRGAQRCGIDKVGPIVTRGVFLDLAATLDGPPPAGHAYRLSTVLDVLGKSGTQPQPGDALVVRTGWLAAWRNGLATTDASAGLHHDCAPWIVDSGFALVAADNVAVEVIPSHDPGCAVPLHIALTRDHGIYLAELLDLEELAQQGAATFMLVIAPLRIRGGVGSPVAPVAVV
jgi:kynurenine formamidase